MSYMKSKSLAVLSTALILSISFESGSARQTGELFDVRDSLEIY